MSNEPDKIIYSMIRVSKRHGQREVLKDISLSYFYGAKIGVLGLNGSGKSSLLKILAGVDQSFEGKTVLAPGYTIGYLEQEPLVNEMRTVREVVEEGAQELVNLVKEFEEINAKFAEPMEPEEMDKLIERQGQVQELMDAKGAWDLDSKLEMAMDALRCPPGDTPVSVISGGEKRRVALCRLLLQNPDILLLDEAFSALDYQTRLTVTEDVYRILKQEGVTTLMVTHDIPESISMGDRVMILTARPARIREMLDIRFEGAARTPLTCRNDPQFGKYFDHIWKELVAS